MSLLEFVIEQLRIRLSEVPDEQTPAEVNRWVHHAIRAYQDQP